MSSSAARQRCAERTDAINKSPSEIFMRRRSNSATGFPVKCRRACLSEHRMSAPGPRAILGAMSAFDALSFWQEPIGGALAWYREVAANRLPAKFRICAALPAGVALEAPEEDQWRALQAGTEGFLKLREAIRFGEARLPRGRPGPSLLDLVAELARRMLAHCNFCRWDCRVDRTRGDKLGACKLPPEPPAP